jgi:nitrogen fixation protein FixH
MSRPGDAVPNGRDLWIPWTIIGGFVAFLASAVVLSIVAVQSDPGLVAGSPAAKVAGSYIMSTAPAPALDLRIARRRGNEIEIEARLLRPDGTPGLAEALVAVLQRPTDAEADQAVPFTPQTDGTWRAILRPPGPGAWEVAVQARDAAGGIAAASLRL